MTGKVGRPGVGAAAAARPEQRPGLVRHGRAARHLLRLPPGGRRGRRAARSRRRWGVDAAARARAEDPGDVRRRRRRRPEGDVHLRRGRRADRPEHRRTSSTRSSRSSSSSARTSSRPRPRSYADVVLPASSFLEKTGTFTNAERRIQLVAAGDRPARARRGPTSTSCAPSPRRSATTWASPGPRTAMAEIAALTPEFAGVTYERLGRRGPAVAGRRRRHGRADPLRARVPPRRRRARTSPRCPYKEPGDAADEDFPLVLVTGRRLQHYNAGTMTRRTGNLELMDRDWLEIHPDDAARLWIADGDVVSVRSRVGRIEIARARDRADRAGPRLHGLPLPGGAHEPPDRLVGRREHVVPGVQGRRRRRAAGHRGAGAHARRSRAT